MKIKYIDGNVLHASEQYIAHGCNCLGIMGAGVAKGIRGYYPEAFKIYQDLCIKSKPEDLLGKIQFVNSKNKTIINCFTQLRTSFDSQAVSYSAIKNCFSALNSASVVRNIVSVALPKIGAGLGGGDWTIIEKIIEEESIDFQPIVYTLAK